MWNSVEPTPARWLLCTRVQMCLNSSTFTEVKINIFKGTQAALHLTRKSLYKREVTASAKLMFS